MSRSCTDNLRLFRRDTATRRRLLHWTTAPEIDSKKSVTATLRLTVSRSQDPHSGREALALPLIFNQTIVQAIVQTAWTSLPEFDAIRHQTIAAPVIGTVRLGVHETRLGGFEQTFEFFTVGDHPALRRCPGTQAAPE